MISKDLTIYEYFKNAKVVVPPARYLASLRTCALVRRVVVGAVTLWLLGCAFTHVRMLVVQVVRICGFAWRRTPA